MDTVTARAVSPRCPRYDRAIQQTLRRACLRAFRGCRLSQGSLHHSSLLAHRIWQAVPDHSAPRERTHPSLFPNLLECHVLAGMRKVYDLKLPRVRSALRKVSEQFPQSHPLISEVFLTDRKDLF